MAKWLRKNYRRAALVVGAAAGAVCPFVATPYSRPCEVIARLLASIGGAS